MTDLTALDEAYKENPGALEFHTIQRRALNVDYLPPTTIFQMFGRPWLMINSTGYLQDIYVNKNPKIERDYGNGYEFEPLVGKSFNFASSLDPVTAEKRKELSGAFYKKRLIQMSKVIQRVALSTIKSWSAEGRR